LTRWSRDMSVYFRSAYFMSVRVRSTGVDHGLSPIFILLTSIAIATLWIHHIFVLQKPLTQLLHLVFLGKNKIKPSPLNSQPTHTRRLNQLRLKNRPRNRWLPSKEVGEYLRAIDRLEQGLSSGKITPEELDKALNSLQEKLSSLSAEQKKKLMGMEFFVKNKIENIRSFRNSLSGMLNDDKTRLEGLDFLRNKQFVALLNQLEGTQDKNSTYNHAARLGSMKSATPPSIKAWFSFKKRRKC